MNMILHGGTLCIPTRLPKTCPIYKKNRYDAVLPNPPFGGKERVEVQQNFPIKTGENASLLFQHFIKMLKVDGKAGVIIQNTLLSNANNASIRLRKLLLENCNLHTVLDFQDGTFIGAGLKTLVPGALTQTV